MWEGYHQFVLRQRARQRLLLCAPLGIGAGIIGREVFGWIEEVSILVGWILGAGSYLVLLGFVIFMADAPMTQRRVSKDNPSPKYLLLVVTAVALLGNATLGVFLTSVGKRPPAHASSLIALSLLSGVLSWFLLHTAFG